MLNLTIICVGGLKESFWKQACAEYEKRLGAWAKVSVEEVPEERLPARPSPAEIKAALEAEGRRVEEKIPRGAILTALCIEGRPMSSEDFADRIGKDMQQSGCLAFAIGGSHGLSDGVKNRARLKLSFSPMTFPHMAARVLLFEQLYRALSILNGGQYHK